MNIIFCITSSFLAIILLFVFIAYFRTKRELVKTNKELKEVKSQINDLVDSSKAYDRLGVDNIKLEVGNGLLCIADPRQEGELVYKIAVMRQQLLDNVGYIVPEIRICDSNELGENEFAISIHGSEVFKNSVYPDRFLTFVGDYEKNGQNVPNDKISYNTKWQGEGYWITKENAEKLSKNIECKKPTDVMMDFLKHIVIEYVNDIITIKEANKYIESVRKNYSSLVVDEVLELIPVSTIRQILSNLVREEVSIKDIGLIFDKLCDLARFSQEADILSERIRTAFGQQIMNKNTVYNTLFAVTIKQDWEQLLDEACQRTELGTMFLLSPMLVQKLIETVAITLIEVHKKINQQPVILCPPRIRLPLYQLLVRHIPSIVVISYSELTTNIKVEAIDTIGENDSYEKLKSLE